MSARPRLLFVGHRLPYPPVKGEKIRAWHLLRHFAESWDVHYGCVIDDAADWAHLDAVRPYCAELACFPVSKSRQKLRALLRARPGRPLMLDYYRDAGLHAWAAATLAAGVDLAFIFSTAMAPYVLPRTTAARVVLDMVDVDSEKWAEYARRTRPPMRWVWAREARTLLAYERQAAAACDATLLVSAPECRRLEALAPELEGRLHAVEQGVDLAYFAPGLALGSPYQGPGPRCVFTGNMDYWPNADAALWFADEVLPGLRARHPGAQFVIVGANPGPEIRALAARPGITVTGRVPDIRPYVAHAEVAVAPLRIARGIQNKVLEAMALGTPVVATPQAFEGVRATPGRDLLVADGAAATIEAIAGVLAGAAPGLATAARQVMQQGYGWPATLARLDRLIARLPPTARATVPQADEVPA